MAATNFITPNSLLLAFFLLLTPADPTAADESTPAPVSCPVVEYAAADTFSYFKPPSYPAGAKEGAEHICAVEIAPKSGHAIVLRVFPQRKYPNSVRVELYQLIDSDIVDESNELLAVKEAV